MSIYDGDGNEERQFNISKCQIDTYHTITKINTKFTI